ncbi:MAG TPA: hypothetical protein VGD45_26950 [Steroidobacter sp.]|uniref:hypothetical protein n=1 Tax=Steroidobacter sp. TaxID=1978227 RepID=UPI002EDA64EC
MTRSSDGSATYWLIGLWLLAHAAPAAAYIDPGTGSALFYVVSGLVVSVYFGVRGLYYRVLEAIFRIRHKDQRCDLAIHCEDPRYEITFLPVLKELVARGVEPTFFTMYERDDSYEPLPPKVTHRAIAPGMVGYAYLNNIEANMLVTTTPQLDVMTFRRSPRVKHYSILQHALGESRYVRPYAYDFFDSVLCCGEILEANIRKIEGIRGLPAKQLYHTGIPHYEELLKNRHAAPPPSGETVVLVAPSWGPFSMFESFGVDFIAAIARQYRVIVRPHPQMKVSQPELYAKVLAVSGVQVDTSRTPAESMSKAHVLLSDISGIAHEFAFIYERPVLIIDQRRIVGGLEGDLLGGDSELKERCREFIVPVPPSEINNIAAHIGQALVNHSPARLTEVRAQLIYNFGTASRVAAEQISEILVRERASASPKKARVGFSGTPAGLGSQGAA